jgi:glycosyltransferase involved in cell wall biosynthesis
LRILLTNSTDIFAGGEDYVFILAKYLRRRNHDVVVSSNAGHLLLKKCEQEGIPTLGLRYEGMERVFAVARGIRRAFTDHDTEIIHSNANYDRTCAAIASAFSPIPHIAGVHSAHSIQHNLTHLIRNKWGTDHFVADAEAVKQVLMKEDRIPGEHISVIPIGVEDVPEPQRQSARAEFRNQLGVAPDTVVIGNVARLVPFKGHRFLLEAIRDVVSLQKNVVFPIVGDGELLDELQRQADALGIGSYVRWLGFRDHLDRIYPGFDIYCHSSLELAAEAFPIAILRALATGLPVVSSNVGGIGMMVKEGASGFLTPPEQPRPLAEALLRLITNPSLRNAFGKASHELFLSQFHAERMAERVEEVYENALAERES